MKELQYSDQTRLYKISFLGKAKRSTFWKVPEGYRVEGIDKSDITTKSANIEFDISTGVCDEISRRKLWRFKNTRDSTRKDSKKVQITYQGDHFSSRARGNLTIHLALIDSYGGDDDSTLGYSYGGSDDSTACTAPMTPTRTPTRSTSPLRVTVLGQSNSIEDEAISTSANNKEEVPYVFLRF